MMADQQWDKTVFENIHIAHMDTTMNKDYTEEEHIGKGITDQYFTKTRLTQNQSGQTLWINNKEVQQPPDLDQPQLQQEESSTAKQDTTQPPPSLEQPAAYTYILATPNAMAKQESHKPPHRLTSE
eukprot:6404172-Amphidinium_carterae.1